MTADLSLYSAAIIGGRSLHSLFTGVSLKFADAVMVCFCHATAIILSGLGAIKLFKYIPGIRFYCGALVSAMAAFAFVLFPPVNEVKILKKLRKRSKSFVQNSE